MTVKLSQCMIVKNEETNIRKALSWAKDIAFEQIVVDTGSTDRTVEIAEEMGAKIYHFKWIDDFSAAKNYAIDQAKGNWIAFLDADEYMDPEAARKLLQLLERIETYPKKKERPNIIRQPWIQLDDHGKMFASSVQDRIFRNSGIRYQNRIHEVLYSTDHKKLCAHPTNIDLSIYHTGYAKEVYARTQKAQRNIELLEQELKQDPKNYNSWGYLGDSYMVAGRLNEAIDAWNHCMEAPDEAKFQMRRISAASSLMRYALSQGKLEDVHVIYQRLSQEQKEDPDLEYWMGCSYLQENQYPQSIPHLEKALTLLEIYHGTNVYYCASKVPEIYQELVRACEASGDPAGAVRFASVSLNMQSRQEPLLTALLRIFQKHGESPDGVFGFLTKLYDFQDPRETLFVLKCARLAAFRSLEDRLLERLDEKTRQDLLPATSAESWRTYETLFPQLPVRNSQDAHLARLAAFLRRQTPEELLAYLQLRLRQLREENEQNYVNYCASFHQIPFWGTLDPDTENWNVLQRRAAALQSRLEDWIGLYTRLADHASRQTLLALLENWINLDYRLPAQVRDYGCPYFDLDRMSHGEDAVLVDVGAHKGETVQNFVKLFGERYRSIYCYECNPNLLEPLQEALQSLDRIVISTSAVGSRRSEGEFLLSEDNDLLSALWLPDPDSESSFETSELVSVVPLDEEIAEPVSILKINVCGMEEEVLKGAANHIRKDRPLLALAAFYRYDQLPDLMDTVLEICPDYRFYLRHYGGNLVPTDYVLYAQCDR